MQCATYLKSAIFLERLHEQEQLMRQESDPKKKENSVHTGVENFSFSGDCAPKKKRYFPVVSGANNIFASQTKSVAICSQNYYYICVFVLREYREKTPLTISKLFYTLFIFFSPPHDPHLMTVLFSYSNTLPIYLFFFRLPNLYSFHTCEV